MDVTEEELSGSAATQITFSGLTWNVKSSLTGKIGPGPNYWNPANVLVDTKGRLRVRIGHMADGHWACAEISTVETFGEGTFEFHFCAPVTVMMDRFMVLGMFCYDDSGESVDGTNEIDIELARWGNPAWPNGNFTSWGPEVKPNNGQVASYTFQCVTPSPSGTTRVRFIRTPATAEVPAKIVWQIFNMDANLMKQWETPADYIVPSKPLNVHINFWLYQGIPPEDPVAKGATQLEIAFTKFSYKSIADLSEPVD